MTQNNNIVIGLTGGTGTGKTTICNILKGLENSRINNTNINSISIIDADRIGHNIIKKGTPAYNEIINYFGSDLILDNQGDQEISRKALGSIVFNDAEKLKFLTATTHKYIIAKILEDININKINNNNNNNNNINKDVNFIIIDAPLLIEANLHNHADTVWIVHSDLDVRLKRLKLRDSLTEDVLLKRINNQTPFDVNKKYADFIIINNNLDDSTLKEIIITKIKDLIVR
ncbi:MAG: dephospho-CoA kinase [bacterium]